MKATNTEEMTLNDITTMTEDLSLTFSSKEEYLEFVRNWKEAYRLLSKHIRKFKSNCAKLNKKEHGLTHEQYTALQNATPGSEPYKYFWTRMEQRELANRLLDLRKNAKLIAGQKWEEQNTLVTPN